MGCIFCGTKDNISTSIKVKTAKGESTEPVCAAHEDEASPKKVRELVELRETKIAEMSAILEPMGYKIVPISTPVQVAQPIPVVPQAPRPAQEAPTAPGAPVRPRKVNSAARINAPAVDGEAPAQGYDTSDAPALIESEAQEVRGVGGVPVFIPKTLVSEGGTTEITVISGMNNEDLQKRFKGIADGDTKFKTQNYGLKDCNFCRGTGKAKIGGGNCPRCKGVGSL